VGSPVTERGKKQMEKGGEKKTQKVKNQNQNQKHHAPIQRKKEK